MTKMIMEHMSPQYQEEFKFKSFRTMKALSDAIRLYNSRRRDELVEKKRKSKNDRDFDNFGIASLGSSRALPEIQFVSILLASQNSEESWPDLTRVIRDGVKQAAQKIINNRS